MILNVKPNMFFTFIGPLSLDLDVTIPETVGNVDRRVVTPNCVLSLNKYSVGVGHRTCPLHRHI